MKRYEIIEAISNPENNILIEKILPYKRSLHVYYSRLFCCEPILMVISVSNAVQYGTIVPSNGFSEALDHYINSCQFESEEDAEAERETVSFNSIYLSKL
jgi:hypothetical protein